MSNNQLALDYAAGFTATTAAATTAMTAVAVVTTGTWIGVPWPVVAIGGGVLATGAATVSRWRANLDRPHKVPTALAISWALWTLEASISLYLNPMTWDAANYWTALAIFTATWVTTYAVLDRADIADEAHYAETLTNNGATPTETKALIDIEHNKGRRHDLATKWAEAIKATMGITPTIVGLREWEPINGTSPGLTITLDLPKGTSRSNFTTATVVQLAADADLPNGCTITPAKGDRQSQILLHIETTNPATITHYHPRDYSPRSIHDMQHWGYSPHGQPIGPELRESGAIIVGPMGTGKTMLLNNIISQFARCTDVIVWGIDVGKQGLAFRPWVEDLPAGSKRVVDQVATNEQEALSMFQQAYRAATKRVHHYAPLMKELNTDLVPISPQIPYIVIIIDEAAELFSIENSHPLANKIRSEALKLMRTSRQAGIRTIITFTKADVITSGASDMIDYHPVKVGLVGDKDSRATAPTKLFGQVKGVDFEQIRSKGSGVADYGMGPEIHHGMLSQPDMMDECVIQCSQLRPTLDQPSADACGTDYINRWNDDTPTTSETPASTPTHKPVAWTLTNTDDIDMDEFEREFNLTHTDTDDGDDPLGWLTRASAEVAQRAPTPATPVGPVVDGWRKVVLDHLATNQHDSYSTSDLVWILANQYGTTIARQTLSTQLTTWANEGTITVIGTGAHRTYTHPKDYH